jgi:hypothetical protein
MPGNGGSLVKALHGPLRQRAQMKQRFALALAGTLSLAFLFGDAIQAKDPPARHSLESDYGFMIGRWTCHITQAGTPDEDASVEYEWA